MTASRALLTVLTSLILLAGCGGSGDDSSTSTSQAAADTPHATALAVSQSAAVARENAAMDKLLQGFNVKANGWTKGPTLDAIINIYQRTRDPKYRTLIDDSFTHGRGWRSGDSNKLYYDDMGWYANAWLRAYDVTGEAAFLTEAQAIFSDMAKAWDDTCGGGIWWTDERTYKNAIANELFLLVASRLARRSPNGTGPGSYHDWALKESDWFVNKSGMINAQGLVNDGLTIVKNGATTTCKNNNQATWSYNQGVILSGLAEMFRLTADRGYLASAEKIADAATTRMVHPNGALRDVCDSGPNTCGGDAVIFKGPFAQGLARLYNADRGNKPQYLTFLNVSADSLWNNSRDAQNGLGTNWGGPVGVPSQSSQASALQLLGGINLLTAFPRGEEQWETPPPPPKPEVSALKVSDSANAAAWSVQKNLQAGNLAYGDRSYTFTGVPADVAGAIWIRSANSSKLYTGSPVVSFTVSAAADVYLALDNRTARPSWVDGTWTDTGADLTQAESSTVSRGFSLYKKHFAAGTVSLGAWNRGAATSMYTVLVK